MRVDKSEVAIGTRVNTIEANDNGDPVNIKVKLSALWLFGFHSLQST